MEMGIEVGLLTYGLGLVGQWFNTRTVRYAQAPILVRVLCLAPARRLVDVGAACLQLNGLYDLLVYGLAHLAGIPDPWPTRLYVAGFAVTGAALVYNMVLADREGKQDKKPRRMDKKH